MNRADAFLAHVIITGKTSLTAAELQRLQTLAGMWIPAGTKVQKIDDNSGGVFAPGTPAGDQSALPPFSGTVASVEDDGRLHITLDAPIEIDQNGSTVTINEVTVHPETVEPVTP